MAIALRRDLKRPNPHRPINECNRPSSDGATRQHTHTFPLRAQLKAPSPLNGCRTPVRTSTGVPPIQGAPNRKGQGHQGPVTKEGDVPSWQIPRRCAPLDEDSSMTGCRSSGRRSTDPRQLTSRPGRCDEQCVVTGRIRRPIPRRQHEAAPASAVDGRRPTAAAIFHYRG